MQTWEIDPITGDYIVENGVPKETNSLKVPAYFRLKTKRTKWLYAPDNRFGSDYYTVVKRPAVSSNQRLENIGLASLQPLLDDGRASEIEVTVVENVRHGSGLQVTSVDASGNVETTVFKGLG